MWYVTQREEEEKEGEEKRRGKNNEKNERERGGVMEVSPVCYLVSYDWSMWYVVTKKRRRGKRKTKRGKHWALARHAWWYVEGKGRVTYHFILLIIDP